MRQFFWYLTLSEINFSYSIIPLHCLEVGFDSFYLFNPTSVHCQASGNPVKKV
jgi:hypothetical protein